ncbi:MAG TPA: protein-glutamate O-methyltransferase CheR [bacterium]|jgi:chemotaxis protein methyltransferase CheR|nr:protein-glutamate O-methyltransferase CheR [bacterium]
MFRSAVTRLLGLQFGDDKLDFLETVLARRAKEAGQDSGSYLRSLEEGPTGKGEAAALAEALTVTETFFLRNGDHFKALVSEALPRRLNASFPRRRLRIVSAACASGEEAYSLAIVLKENFPDFAPGELSITAVDVNPAMLRIAAEGLYSTWSMRETPSAMRDKYFRAAGKNFQLREDILGAVRFEHRNLAEPNSDLWQPSSLDVVFCRNMLMYLSPEAAVALVARIARALAPGGYLFLGHAETLRGLSRDFHLCHTHETFYYRRQDSAEILDLPPPQVPAAVVEPEGPMAWDPSLSWVEAIQRSSQRIADLAGASPARDQAAAVLAGVPGESRNLAPIFELMGRERFTDALESLERLTQGGERDGDVQLLGAVLLANLGRRAEAREACLRLLARDEFNAGAHYVLALCHEHAGDLAAAVDEDRTAVYLDPGFALPLMHLGLLARRAEPWRSRVYLGQALQLLAREDSSRVLLFGGGFSRQGLLQICRNALDSCEVAP